MSAPEAAEPGAAPTGRVVPLTILALLAFAGNSLLVRQPLGQGWMGPNELTVVRLGSGAAILWVLCRARRIPLFGERGGWARAFQLLLYAGAFSVSYTRIDAGMGALLLFGATQLTMVLGAIARGQRPTRLELVALVGGLGGLGYLVSPGLAAPDLLGASIMLAAGVGWGLYSLAGKTAGDPLATTASAFAQATLLSLPLLALALLGDGPSLRVSGRGLVYAITSGAITSGLGYAVWYAALRDLGRTRAAIVQLAVPPLAALGGVLLLGERFTFRLGVASVVILGSVALGTLGRSRAEPGCPA